MRHRKKRFSSRHQGTSRSERPVFYIGQGVLCTQTSTKLTELVELTQIPVITSMPGKSAIDKCTHVHLVLLTR
ncbi:MAG: hypothetical protein CL726_05015 [Chloroflexi bacterium]|nr:hypothetical protein [Chloroflexota bacterium]